jgi:hypothetical protein
MEWIPFLQRTARKLLFNLHIRCMIFRLYEYIKNGVLWDVTPCGSLRTDVSEELSASFNRVTRIGELETTLAVTSNRRTLHALSSSETSVLTRATRRNIPEDAIPHIHRRENLKSYIVFLYEEATHRNI